MNSVIWTAVLVLTLAGCRSDLERPEETKPPVYSAPEYLLEVTKELSDGRTVTCIYVNSVGGGISCDWDNASVGGDS